MNIAIIGSRNFSDYSFMKNSILNIVKIEDIDYVVSGGAKGADTLGELFAKEYNLKTMIFKPEWKRYGKAAGVIRNTEIVKNADIIMAFPMGSSKGTYDSIHKARKSHKNVYIFSVDSETSGTPKKFPRPDPAGSPGTPSRPAAEKAETAEAAGEAPGAPDLQDCSAGQSCGRDIAAAGHPFFTLKPRDIH
ncbi:SLOG family protein [uncultured Mailhella sp.]|uniref:SLOG family protein n=1 Tax=uncultured Mailhella sp. TaxID=1981031 RepID=UPI0026356D40|nr:SLOG family protein [uncultured Mailhella sp.]